MDSQQRPPAQSRPSEKHAAASLEPRAFGQDQRAPEPERAGVRAAAPEIYELVWGGTMPRRDRSVDVFARKVRHKLRIAAPGWDYVHTHFGIGYRFAPERTPGGL